MARRFLSNDTITTAIGSAPTTRAGTTVLLIRAYDAAFDLLAHDSDFVTGYATSAAVSATFITGGKVFSNNDFGSGLAGPTDKTVWYVVAATKTSGTVAYTYLIAPLGGAWTTGTSGTSNDGSGVNNLVFGKGLLGAAKFEIAACAMWSTPLSSAAIQALGTTNMNTWMAASPNAAWQFNQASTATAVVDLTGHGADQTAISGTSVVTDPVGWTYYSATTPFTKDVVERYRVYAGFTKDVAETYRVFNSFTKDVVERYRVTNAWTKDVSETYRVLGGFTKDVVERYRVYGTWTKDIVESYRVLNGWTKDTVERYRVLNGWTKDTVETYRVLNAWTKDTVERYRVLNSWTSDVTERYRVLNGWSQDLIERYSVLSNTAWTKDVVERYRIYNLLVKDIVERYTIHAAGVVRRADAIALLGPVIATARVSGPVTTIAAITPVTVTVSLHT
jgi:hypothetical protein